MVFLRSATVRQVKQKLEHLTGVATDGQKLCGLLPRGKQPMDSQKLSDLPIKTPLKCMMVGTVQEVSVPGTVIVIATSTGSICAFSFGSHRCWPCIFKILGINFIAALQFTD